MTHIPVLLKNVLEKLNPQPNEWYFDATFGGGGYSEAVLNTASCCVVAVDRDPLTKITAEKFSSLFPNRFTYHNTCFSDIRAVFPNTPLFLDVAMFDFGMSSFQLDTPSRGFSFRFDAPLDMRMSQTGLSAYDVVNTFSQEDLAQIIFLYGEEPFAKRIAKLIVKERAQKKITTTYDLKQVIYRAIPKYKKTRTDPATQTFQAIRIFVNNELEEIHLGLNAVLPFLKIGARILAVTFHGLEDRVVRQWAQPLQDSNVLENLTKKAIQTTEDEKISNPRARSAKLHTYCVLRTV